jgi:exonuclease III
MPEQPDEHHNQADDNDSIRILQINLNKSEKAHLDILNEQVSLKYDIILIQEPYTTTFNGIRTPANFRPVFPTHRFQSEDQIRSVIWVNKNLDTKGWLIIDIPGTSDITAIQLLGPYGKISIFNIYNDCTHSRSENTLRTFLNEHSNNILATENHHMIWAGDFNRHHPLWDRDEDTHLFTQQATRQAEGIIELIATYDLVMSLPKGIPTLQHMVTKRYSRPDNVFTTVALSDHVIKCEVEPSIRPTSTDHFPIVTNILLPQERTTTPPAHNFREADWDELRKKLKNKLSTTPEPPTIDTHDQLTREAEHLTTALQEAIQESVPKTKPRPDAKRWWNGDLTKMRKELNRLRANSFRYRAMADHPSHQTLRTKSSEYGEAIVQTKRQHWINYLEEMTADDIWTWPRRYPQYSTTKMC